MTTKQHARRLESLALEMKQELDYFKDGVPMDREILKKTLRGFMAGYISSLLASLYNEDELEIWKTFSGHK